MLKRVNTFLLHTSVRMLASYVLTCVLQPELFLPLGLKCALGCRSWKCVRRLSTSSLSRCTITTTTDSAQFPSCTTPSSFPILKKRPFVLVFCIFCIQERVLQLYCDQKFFFLCDKAMFLVVCLKTWFLSLKSELKPEVNSVNFEFSYRKRTTLNETRKKGFTMATGN